MLLVFIATIRGSVQDEYGFVCVWAGVPPPLPLAFLLWMLLLFVSLFSFWLESLVLAGGIRFASTSDLLCTLAKVHVSSATGLYVMQRKEPKKIVVVALAWIRTAILAGGIAVVRSGFVVMLRVLLRLKLFFGDLATGRAAHGAKKKSCGWCDDCALELVFREDRRKLRCDKLDLKESASLLLRRLYSAVS